MTKKMYRANDLDALVGNIEWEYKIPYRDLSKIDVSKSTSKNVYVEEPKDDKKLSYRALNLMTFFIEKPEDAERVFRYQFPELYDKYVDTPRGRGLINETRQVTKNDKEMNLVDRNALCPILRIIRKVEGRNVKDSIDSVRRYYVEPYRILVENNPRCFSVGYISHQGSSGEFGAFTERNDMSRVIHSELEQNSAIL